MQPNSRVLGQNQPQNEVLESTYIATKYRPFSFLHNSINVINNATINRYEKMTDSDFGFLNEYQRFGLSYAADLYEENPSLHCRRHSDCLIHSPLSKSIPIQTERFLSTNRSPTLQSKCIRRQFSCLNLGFQWKLSMFNGLPP